MGRKEEEEGPSSEHLQVFQISKETMAITDLNSWKQIIMTVSQQCHNVFTLNSQQCPCQ